MARNPATHQFRIVPDVYVVRQEQTCPLTLPENTGFAPNLAQAHGMALENMACILHNVYGLVPGTFSVGIRL